MIISVTNQKGGVGKTTTAINLCANLAKRGHRVLLIDIDPQANTSRGVGVTLSRDEESIYEVLLNPKAGLDYAIRQVQENFDLVPSLLALAGAELELAGRIGRESLLREAILPVRDRYDYIVIDSPPNLGVFTMNALTAAQWVLVPVEVQVFPFDALEQLEETVELIKKINPDLSIGAILCTKYMRTANLSGAIESQLRERYGSRVLDTIIPFNIKLAEAPASGTSALLYAPDSKGALAYADLADELIAKYGN